MNEDQKIIITKVWKQAVEAIHLVEASLKDMVPFDAYKDYTPTRARAL